MIHQKNNMIKINRKQPNNSNQILVYFLFGLIGCATLIILLIVILFIYFLFFSPINKKSHISNDYQITLPNDYYYDSENNNKDDQLDYFFNQFFSGNEFDPNYDYQSVPDYPSVNYT